MKSARKPMLLAVAATLALAVLLPTGAAADPKRKVQRHRDSRHGHNRHYASHGHAVRTLPRHHRRISVRGKPYFYHRGLFYRPHGAEFVISAAPFGAIIGILPPGYVTLYFGNAPYYYANSTYYVWDRGARGYRVIEEPTDFSGATVVPNEFFIYPRQGQSEERLAKDRYECHLWAVNRTGNDPSADYALEDEARAEYRRAMSACLEARSYAVR